MRRPLAAALLALPGMPAIACPLPAPAMQQGAVQAAWRVAGEAIAVGRHFAIELRLCPADARLLRVDATMPEHRHGMNYRASLTPLGDGRWRAEGLLLHMPGRWELRIDVQAADGSESFREAIDLQ